MHPDFFPVLIQRIRAGEAEAASELLREYEPEIRRFVRVRLEDPRLRRILDSMDICQSIFGNFFLRAMGGQFELASPGQLLNLLKTMAYNRIIDYARMPEQRHGANADSGTWATVPSNEDTPSQIASTQELVAKFWQALSDEERELAELRKQGLSWDTIAERCGGTAAARCKELSRAIDRVCQGLGLDETPHA
jgi:RNA polymerase sigma-70 factor (ECF subfamily)